jgi:carboxyl-terminal processing protease
VLALGGFQAGPLTAAEAVVAQPGKTALTNSTSATRPPPTPGADAGRIAFVTAGILEQLHYSRREFNDETSNKFLEQYLNTLDPQHLHFIQADLDSFASYRTNLDDLTLTSRRVADASPAYVIFSRFVERLQQRSAYAEELLKTEKFDFTGDDRIAVNRHTMPYPQDLAEAKKLWQQRLRYEYLMQKLTLQDAKKASATNAASATNTVPTADGKVEPAKSMDEQIAETLTKLYHRNLKMFQDFDGSDILTHYLNALAHTYDPHSDYQGPPDAEDFAMQMNLSFFGIGAALRTDPDTGYCTVSELMNGPALKSKKLKVGDRIVAVAQSNQPPVDIVEMPLNKAVRLIRGPKGTEVRLTVIPGAAGDLTRRETISLVRDEISLDSGEAKGRVIDLPEAGGNHRLRVGVIDLPSFYGTIDGRNHATPKSTTTDVARLLKKFEEEKVTGVILDLRYNGGGLLEEAVRLAGLFIKTGPVVQIRDGSGQTIVDQDDDPSITYDGPLVVLTSKLSASASEIVAAALQDYGRAIIVGDNSTFGKGTAQRLIPLRAVPAMQSLSSEPGQLKITNSKFYRASGASTELRGVVPDIILPSILNESPDIGESQLDNHLPWDEIKGANYEKFNLVQPFLAELLKRSGERIATNREYVYLREDIETFRKLQADKTISLNEKQHLKDRQEADARKKTREKERQARKDTPEKVYELTLKDVDKPGLPEPVKKTNSVATANGTIQTNATALAENDPDAAEADETLDDSGWRRKAALEETERILVDYLSMLPKDKPVVVAH